MLFLSSTHQTWKYVTSLIAFESFISSSLRANLSLNIVLGIVPISGMFANAPFVLIPLHSYLCLLYASVEFGK